MYAEPGTPFVGFPAWLDLCAFGDVLFEAFDEIPLLVGSATEGKDWRDIDVRVVLPDDVFAEQYGDVPNIATMPHSRWGAMCRAFSVLGQQMTGLPVDFQIWNAERSDIEGGIRIPLVYP